jgi:hypothetical protein
MHHASTLSSCYWLFMVMTRFVLLTQGATCIINGLKFFIVSFLLFIFLARLAASTWQVVSHNECASHVISISNIY